MQIRIDDPNLIRVQDVPQYLPRNVAHVTVKRWIYRGHHGVRLATIKVRHQRYTTAEAIQAFAEATSKSSVGATR
jgi:RNA binding exosome subunit